MRLIGAASIVTITNHVSEAVVVRLVGLSARLSRRGEHFAPVSPEGAAWRPRAVRVPPGRTVGVDQNVVCTYQVKDWRPAEVAVRVSGSPPWTVRRSFQVKASQAYD